MKENTDLDDIVTALKCGEYDGTHIMRAWIAIERLIKLEDSVGNEPSTEPAKLYTVRPDDGEYMYDRMDRARKARGISDEEFFTSNKGWSDHIPTEVEQPIYEGVASKVRDAQRLLNVSMFTAIRVSEYTEEFNVWFEYQSFAWVPKFCKPLIKNWVKHSFMAGKGCFK